MKLADLRKIAVKKRVRIRFALSNGMECIINEHGIAQIPALRAVPDFNLEQEFARTNSFTMEPAVEKTRPEHRGLERLNRSQLEVLLGSGEPVHDDHDE